MGPDRAREDRAVEYRKIFDLVVAAVAVDHAAFFVLAHRAAAHQVRGHQPDSMLAHRQRVDRGLGLAPAAMVSAVEMARPHARRSEEHTSELQSLMRISYAVFCLKKKTTTHQ